MKKFYITFFIEIFLLGILPQLVFADEIRIDAKKVDVNIGEQFLVDVVASSNVELNAVEGNVSYPKDILSITDIRDGNSVINFWIEKPKDDNGNIRFSGVTPVGFKGTTEKIFTILFTPKKSGTVEIKLSDVTGYLNDGTGNKAKISPVSAMIQIRENSISSTENIIDKEPPEDFTPIMVNDKSINNGAISLLFATQDKGIGIDSYYIKEGKYDFYRKADSPYKIADSNLIKDIYIKAVDKSGNERIVIFPAKNKATLFNVIDEFKYQIILVLVLVGAFISLWKRLKK